MIHLQAARALLVNYTALVAIGLGVDGGAILTTDAR